MTAERAIYLLAAGQTLVWAGLYYIFPALILAWEADRGWSRGTLTLALTLSVGVAALASPLAGRLIDRGHGRVVLSGSALAGAALLAALPAVQSLAAFYAVWLAIGLAMGGCLYEPCFAFVSRARGPDARRAITQITLVAGFASSLAFPVAGGLATSAGWEWSVRLFALLIAGVAVPLFWSACGALERGVVTPAAPSPTVPFRALAGRPGFAALAFAFSAVALIHGMLVNHLLPILAERGVAEATALLAAALIGPMQVAGRLGMMAGEKHLSASAIATASLVALGAASAALLAGGLALLAAFVVLQGAAYGVAAILRPVLAAEVLGPRNVGAAIGLLALPYLAASAVAPVAGSLLWQAVGYDGMLGVTVLLALAALLAFRGALRGEARRLSP